MIAAVTGENILNMMKQQADGNGALTDGDGFNALLNMLMSIEPQAVAPAASDETPADLLDLMLPESGEGKNQAQADEDDTNPAACAATPGAPLIQALALWMQPQDETTETASAAENTTAQAATPTQEKTASVAPPAPTLAELSTIPLPDAIATMLARAAEAQLGSATTGQAADTGENPTQTTAVVEATTIQAATDPKTVTAPAAILNKFQNKPSTAAPTDEASESNSAAAPAKSARVEAVSNAAGATGSESAATGEDSDKTAEQPESKTGEPKPVFDMTAMMNWTAAPQAAQTTVTPNTTAETVAPQAEQTTVTPNTTAETVAPPAGTTTMATPRPAAAAGQTTTTPVAQGAPSTNAPAAIPTANTEQTPATTAEPMKWNLAELVHRFEEPLAQTVADKQATVEPQTESIAGTIKSATQAAGLRLSATVTEPKQTKTADSTVTVAAVQAPTATWQAEPIQDTAGAARTPAMTEQMRQASQWLAEKAEGSIRVGDQGTEATLRLNPADLGGVQVSLNVGHDLTVQAQFVAERPETAQALQQNLNQLQEAFTRQGLTLDKVQVTVAPAASQNSGSTQNQQNYSGMKRDSQTAGQDTRRGSDGRSAQDERRRQNS